MQKIDLCGRLTLDQLCFIKRAKEVGTRLYLRLWRPELFDRLIMHFDSRSAERSVRGGDFCTSIPSLRGGGCLVSAGDNPCTSAPLHVSGGGGNRGLREAMLIFCELIEG